MLGPKAKQKIDPGCEICLLRQYIQCQSAQHLNRLTENISYTWRRVSESLGRTEWCDLVASWKIATK